MEVFRPGNTFGELFLRTSARRMYMPSSTIPPNI